jgi:hypothetical protein
MTPPCPHDNHPEGCPSCASSVDLLRNPQAEVALRQARGARGQQTLLTIVCAWCQQTIRWQRTEGAAQGQISHSICFDCFADLLQELAPQNAPPPFSKKVHQRSSYAQP